MKYLGLGLVIFASASFAQSTQDRITCPNITEDARLLLTSVQTLQDQLRQLPECQTVSSKIALINKVLENDKWKDVKNIITTQGTASLEGDDVAAITQLTTEVSTALADTISMLSGNSSHCMPSKDKPTFLGTLSSITKEVAGITGNITGPYGQAISMVGNLISGAIAGVDQLFKQNKLYSFYRPAEEMLFMNQFCAFTQSQQDVRDYLEMEEKPAQLEGMVKYLTENKINDLVKNCPECEGYKIAYEAKEIADRTVKAIVADANIVEMPRNGLPHTFTRCAEIHRAFYSSDSDFSKLMKQLQDYRNPMMSSSDQELIAEMTGATKTLKSIYPSYTECISMDNLAISVKFNDFMRDDILRLPETIFSQQLTFFQYMANRNYRGGKNGDYIATSMSRMKWAKEESLRIRQLLNEPNYYMSKQVVMSQQDELRYRLLSRLMPSYLRYRFRDNKRDTQRFMSHFKSFSTRELSYFNKKLKTPAKTLTELAAALKNDKSLARYFVSSYDRVFNESRIVILQVLNNKRFCDYLLYSRSMTVANRAVCDKRLAEMEELQKQFSTFKEDLEVIVDFDKWADENLSVQSTFVRDYSERIREWNALGDDRWERIQTRY